MTLRRLSANDFRNITSLDIELSPRLNIFYGANGSGKTSILEAVSTLSLGRSFRSHKYKTIIRYDCSAFTVFGQVFDSQLKSCIPVGIKRDRQGQALIKKAGQVCRSAAELAALLPTRVMNGHSFGLLEGAPEIRRQFLDWLVFHVEPSFYDVWKSYQKCLKHRNSLLRRDKIDKLYLEPWDKELAKLAHKLDSYRATAFELLEQQLHSLMVSVSDEVDLPLVKLRYYRGWDAETDIASLLDQTLERDIELGYTRQGPHRADIRVQVEGNLLAVDVLSRGQQKILVSAMLIAQGNVFHQGTNRHCVYLIDDLPAELDTDFRRRLAAWLDDMGCQVFVTGVELNSILEAWPQTTLQDANVFHVKHGKIDLEQQ